MRQKLNLSTGKCKSHPNQQHVKRYKSKHYFVNIAATRLPFLGNKSSEFLGLFDSVQFAGRFDTLLVWTGHESGVDCIRCACGGWVDWPAHAVDEEQRELCSESPSHLAPPCTGDGLVQVRTRRRTPRPHDALHELHSLHTDQPPFTASAPPRITIQRNRT